ncbi:hypothetical protein PPTG_11651 [Phytophthora nicotianae INRA-310]|uniref:Uncharacterized protein n=1 Tax=Phytophthora nicotianae (strain INRA-310) TaxID=761204 RepID=W2Q6S1_PHYN3|nr:hypothetical protein PPTG_11651 [Phytophthora nicotianae INRA-310]ETN08837.1 hypothetical protein PPTG_11651 [Phytophthora nicotianae INRA-310]
MRSFSPSDAVTPENLIQDWAISTTEAWTNEVKAEWKRQRRCETLVRFRKQKKKKTANMILERDRLELEVKQRLAALREAVAQRSDDGIPTKSNKTRDTVCCLALESDALRNENLEMHQRLLQFKRLWSIIDEGLLEVTTQGLYLNGYNVYEASDRSRWVRQTEAGWRVSFPNGEPSFFFEPFLREEFDAMYKKCIEELLKPQHIDPAGTLFGWTVNYATNFRSFEDNYIVARARFSKRVRCSLDYVDGVITASDLNGLPLIVTSLGRERSAVSIQVLQKFEKDAHIMVCNMSGSPNFRYLFLLKREPHLLLDGTRTVAYTMAIVNSNANTRARSAEEPHSEVEWAHEGSNVLLVTEVDDNTVDVKFDFKASCQDDLHARFVCIQWAQFVSRWLQGVDPLALLASQDEYVL